MERSDIAVRKYVVDLSAEERQQLEDVIHGGKHAAGRLTRARILLKADVSPAGDGWSDGRIVEALDESTTTIYNVRKQMCEEGFDAVLTRKQRATPPVAPIFDGEKEAKLIALACSTTLTSSRRKVQRACPSGGVEQPNPPMVFA